MKYTILLIGLFMLADSAALSQSKAVNRGKYQIILTILMKKSNSTDYSMRDSGRELKKQENFKG